MIELRHLRYFVAVAETLNFSRAAERLHMAQPPLSLAIRQLEQELGTELFVRTTREVKLTEAGRALLDGAGRVLTELDGAITAARRAAAGELGGVRLAFSWSARFETLPSLGQAFRARHPDVELVTEQMWNARMPDALRSGAIDIALSICPEVAGDLSYQLVRREAVVALLPADHRLAGESEIPLAALEGDEHLLFPRDLAPHLHDFFVGLCRRAGFEPTTRNASFHSDWEIRGLGDMTGFALIPESVARNLPRGVVAVTLSEPRDQLATSLVWRTNVLAPAAAALRDLAPTLRF